MEAAKKIKNLFLLFSSNLVIALRIIRVTAKSQILLDTWETLSLKLSPKNFRIYKKVPAFALPMPKCVLKSHQKQIGFKEADMKTVRTAFLTGALMALLLAVTPAFGQMMGEKEGEQMGGAMGGRRGGMGMMAGE